MNTTIFSAPSKVSPRALRKAQARDWTGKILDARPYAPAGVVAAISVEKPRAKDCLYSHYAVLVNGETYECDCGRTGCIHAAAVHLYLQANP